MGLSAKLRRAPLRLTAGAFILNAGVSKFTAGDETSKALHGMASNSFPLVEKVDHRVFIKGLSVGEIALGSALLLPIVPASVAGLGLMTFSGALLATWWRTPGMHAEGSPRPTQQGTPIAKDVWLFGAGTGLLLDALTEPAHDKKVEVTATVQEKASAKRRAMRRSRKAALAAGAASAAQLMDAARNAQSEVAERGKHATGRASEQAQHASSRIADMSSRIAEQAQHATSKMADQAHAATDKLADLRDEYGPVAADKAKVAADKAKQARKASKKFADSARETAQDVSEKIQNTVK
jgi:uncharacterized membrane protein YphA (DoxX/SURF4 family)